MSKRRLVPKLPHECGPDEESMSLLALCEALHMVATGAADSCMNVDEVRLNLSELQARLKRWEPSTTFAERYDNCIRALIVATIQEWEGRL